MPRGNFNLSTTSELSSQEGIFCKLIFKARLSLVRSYWEGTSLRLALPRGYCGVIFAARQRFTSIGPLGNRPPPPLIFASDSSSLSPPLKQRKKIKNIRNVRHTRRAPDYPAKSKRGREEGDGTENVINCRDVCRKLS